ncbi:MAG: hypothetical protein JW840_05935 [Candidatus Thermoplasmatota archaeon]|nr:hypothetical protein [Candidatus Thermoplasmatota archaeon]
MKVDEWLLFFKQHPQKKLFCLSDLTQLIDEPKKSLSVQLTRLVHAKVLLRAAQGWYANPFHQPSAEEIAMVLRIPCYLSLEYALSRQGILSQAPYTMTLVTTRPPYTFHRKDKRYEYHQIHKSLFWGYEQEQGINIATAEKALLDLLYIRGIRSKQVPTQGFRSLFDDMDLEFLNKNRFKDYANKFRKGTERLAVDLGIIPK